MENDLTINELKTVMSFLSHFKHELIVKLATENKNSGDSATKDDLIGALFHISTKEKELLGIAVKNLQTF